MCGTILQDLKFDQVLSIGKDEIKDTHDDLI
jgi:hypothetical protein